MPLSPDLFVFLLQTYICLVIDTSLTLLVKLIVANVQHEYVFTSGHDAHLQGIVDFLHDIGAIHSLKGPICLSTKSGTGAPT
jgi:hypothetical protein